MPHRRHENQKAVDSFDGEGFEQTGDGAWLPWRGFLEDVRLPAQDGSPSPGGWSMVGNLMQAPREEPSIGSTI